MTRSAKDGTRKPQLRDWDPTGYYKDSTIAERYDALRFTGLTARIFLYLERHFLLKAFEGVAPGSTILDVPCGTGRLAEVLLEAGYDVLGSDIAPEMIAVAEGRLARFGDRFKTFVCDARTLETTPRPVDAALCARVLMHFPPHEQAALLRGVARVCHGPIVFTLPYDSAYQRILRSIKRKLRHWTPVAYPLNDTQLAELLEKAGLRQLRRYALMPLVSETLVVSAIAA